MIHNMQQQTFIMASFSSEAFFNCGCRASNSSCSPRTWDAANANLSNPFKYRFLAVMISSCKFRISHKTWRHYWHIQTHERTHAHPRLSIRMRARHPSSARDLYGTSTQTAIAFIWKSIYWPHRGRGLLRLKTLLGSIFITASTQMHVSMSKLFVH